MISAGIPEEGTIAVFDVNSGLVVKSSAVKTGAIADIAIDPFITTGHVQFTTVGSSGSMMLWRMDDQAEQLQYFEVDTPNVIAHSHLVSCAYTDHIGGSFNTYLTLIGTSDGSLVGFDNKSNSFVHGGQKQGTLRGQIGLISTNQESVVIASSGGSVARYLVKNSETDFNPFPSYNLKIYNLDGAVVSLSMDEINNEGLIGTDSGTLYYINFDEKILLKLLISHTGPVQSLKFGLSEEGAQELLLSASEGGVTIRAAQTLDQVL